MCKNKYVATCTASVVAMAQLDGWRKQYVGQDWRGNLLDLGEFVFGETGVERSGLPSLLLLLLDSAPMRQCRSQRPFCLCASGSGAPAATPEPLFSFSSATTKTNQTYEVHEDIRLCSSGARLWFCIHIYIYCTLNIDGTEYIQPDASMCRGFQ